MTLSKRLTQEVAEAATAKKQEYALPDGQVAGLALRVRPSGAKSWMLRRRYGGKAKRVTFGTLKKMNLDQARAIALGEEALPMPGQKRKADHGEAPLISDLATYYLADREGPDGKKTLEGFRQYLRGQILPNFGTIRVDRLTTPIVAQWFYAYSRTSPGGANQAISLLKALLNFAIRTGYLPHDAPEVTSPIRRNKRRPRGRMLTAQQLTDLGRELARVPARNRWAADAIRLILLTGCRSGEITRLKWSEVKPDRLILTRTKTGPREQVLSRDAITLLKRLRNKRLGPCVFPSKDDQNEPATNLRILWKPIRRRAGLPDDIRLYDLRHSYASHSVMNGESVVMTGKLLGHRDPSSTERYAHLDGEFLTAAADRVSAEVAKAMGL